ncbi:MAG: 5'-methylthioadenosine/adenosylhomocysteine nucleosidase [Clostridiales bacterium]|jgi:adenosylhomocysteine nucleosidase|nr:5'-methylthioadenosine/adenosylhomocysteine nucleosidase [Clostridiales bacterium]
MNTIGIIGAMESEIAQLKNEMEIKSTKKLVNTEFYEGTMTGKNVVLVKCGIGKVNAAVCAQTLINLYNASCVINTGAAGAISGKLNIGDVVVSTDLIQHDFDTSAVGDILGVIPGLSVDSFAADERLIKIAQEAGEEVLAGKNNVFTGRIATGDQFIATKEQKQKIEGSFSAMCAEMEGGAIAQTCWLNNVPFVIVRAISDNADEKATMSFPEFVKLAAKNAACIVRRMITQI